MSFSIFLYKKCASHFRREIANEYKQVKETNIYTKLFQGYRCKSDIAFYLHGRSLDAHSPFKRFVNLISWDPPSKEVYARFRLLITSL